MKRFRQYTIGSLTLEKIKLNQATRKQHETVEYLGCQLDSKLNGEAMASKALKEVNAKLEFLYRLTKYLALTHAYKRLLCNTLIHPHFDYGCSFWFPLLKKNLKIKLEKA